MCVYLLLTCNHKKKQIEETTWKWFYGFSSNRIHILNAKLQLNLFFSSLVAFEVPQVLSKSMLNI